MRLRLFTKLAPDRKLLWLTACLCLLVSCQHTTPAGHVHIRPERLPYPRLSEYNLFADDMKEQQPNESVLPYSLITPLFTDYAHKARFVWMPDSVEASVEEDGRIAFPRYTVLVKSFYYPADFRRPEAEWDMVETRLLIQEAGGWQAYTYVWDEKDEEAYLKKTGDFADVSWIDETGAKRQITYVIPNKNQCKSCHNNRNALEPLGPKVRNLKRSETYADGPAEQLDRWREEGLLGGPIPEAIAPVTDWADSTTGRLHERALAYLDVNCGHCHRPEGPANTTGMYLTWGQTDPTRLGICKPPVAAGRGAGGNRFGISPGHPDSSILVHRMQSEDPGIMMPELGRVIPHKEGIALIKAWIDDMEGSCGRGS